MDEPVRVRADGVLRGDRADLADQTLRNPGDGLRADRRRVHGDHPRHRLDLGQADVGHVVGMGPTPDHRTDSALKPVFDTKGIITAGNASQTSDGAAFVLVASEEMVKLFNWQPIARMVSCSVGGVDPLYMGMGPCAAIPKALKSAGLSLSDIDLVELNEAFAAQALAVIKEGCLNPESVNVNGGAVALGHPLGCTGAKLTTQLINELGRQNKKYGMVTACVGGGQGIAGIYEKL